MEMDLLNSGIVYLRFRQGYLMENPLRAVLHYAAQLALINDLIDVFEYIEQDEENRFKYHYIVFDFRAEPGSGSLKPASDVLEARWVPISRLGDYELTDKAIEVIRKGIK